MSEMKKACHIIEIPHANAAERDAFMRRLAECKTTEERQELLTLATLLHQDKKVPEGEANGE